MSKYALVGLSAGVIDFTVLYILTSWCGLYYLVSATISFCLSAIWNYSFNKRWTFCSNGSHKRQVPIFLIIAGAGLLLNNNIMFLGVEKLGLHYLLAKVVAAALVTSWNFFGNKYLTFRN